MSDNCNSNGSFVDAAIAGVVFGVVIITIALALPILPYLEFIGRTIYAISTPESPFGKIVFWLWFGFIGYWLYEKVNAVARSKFKNIESMYIFLYGQSFLFMAILWGFHFSFVAEMFVSFISWGIAESEEIAVWIIALIGGTLLFLSYKLEVTTRAEILKNTTPKEQLKPITYQTLISDAKEYLTGEKVERNLATAERLLYKAKQLGGDDATKEVQLLIKKYGLVADILK